MIKRTFKRTPYGSARIRVLRANIGPSKKLAAFVGQYAHALRGGCMLELGTGEGRNLQAFTEIGMTAIGLDWDPFALHVAKWSLRKKRIPAGLVRGNMINPPFPKETFTLILSGATLHLICCERHLRVVFREIARMLVPGGLYFYYELSDRPGETGIKGVGAIPRGLFESCAAEAGLVILSAEESVTENKIVPGKMQHGIRAVLRKR